MRSSENTIHKLPFRIWLSFCLQTQCKPSLSQRCLSQLSLLTFKLLFYNNTSILHNTIVYGDIKIYRSIVKTLRFLEKLRCASMMLYAPQLGNQANDCFHFFTVAQLNIDISISGFISIFIKCIMCRVFAHWVTNKEK